MKKVMQLNLWRSTESPTPTRQGGRIFLMAGGFEDSWPLNATKNRGTLLCPKCDCRMVQCLFNGITVEQCENCRGIFFDEGEVDELMGKSRLASRN